MSSTTIAPASTRPRIRRSAEGAEAGGDGEEHPATLDAVRAPAELLALADAGDRAFGQRADPAARRCAPSASAVSGPKMPSLPRPALRWNSVSAPAVSGPKMPSSLPASKPSVLRRRWSSMTSSPRSIGPADVEHPVAEAEAALDQRGPGLATADAVDAQRSVFLERPKFTLRGRSEGPELLGRRSDARARASRCWRSRTASPLLPGRRTAGSLKR